VSDSGWTVTSLPAEVDIANAGQVRADLLGAIDRGHPVVIVDMSRTTFCDCAGISALLAAASHALRAGAEMRIVARARPMLRTFELTGLLLALQVYPTAADARRGPPETALSVPAGSLAFPARVTRLRHSQSTDAD
jgi:anti-anti-sigma factor